jgi:LAO/AO transport system kinase
MSAPTLSRDPGELIDAARQGSRIALARLLTMIERGGTEAESVAALAYQGQHTYTVGLTGPPGAGKSTMTDRLITTARGGWPAVDGQAAESLDQVAVLAIDPSSPFTGGAILGDRIRMQDHATDPSVFIRSMATRGHLGGLALAVPGAVRLLGAVGMPVAIIETVGVGQMEVDIVGAADTTVVVVTPGAGDAMQANKAGILEIADVFVINKADRPGLREARRDLEGMLELSSLGDWTPPIVETIAQDGTGIDLVWNEVARHRAHLISTGELASRRRRRLTEELRRVVAARLSERVEQLAGGQAFSDQVAALDAGQTDPFRAAAALLED